MSHEHLAHFESSFHTVTGSLIGRSSLLFDRMEFAQRSPDWVNKDTSNPNEDSLSFSFREVAWSGFSGMVFVGRAPANKGHYYHSLAVLIKWSDHAKNGSIFSGGLITLQQELNQHLGVKRTLQ